MAGLCGLKILLVCAGIIILANCQDGDQPAGQPNIAQGANTTATPAPPASTLPSPSPSPSTTPSTTPKLDSQANTTQSQTSPPITISITTVTPTKATTPAPPQCSYTVKAIRFGFQIDMMTSTTGNYTINIKEKGRPKTEERSTVHSFIQNSKHEIKDLKPCTEYEHNVTFIDSAGNVTSCNNTENKTQTITISEGDISEGSCKPGYVCYRSDWDISSSLFSSNNIPAEKCTNDSTFFCIKPRYDDICTDLTTTFTSETCLSSFNLTRSITVDSLDPEINQTFLNELPVKIESIKPKLPPNCNHLTIDYTCRENGNNHTKELSELEPFTEYSCNGQIKENNVTIKNTSTFNFRVDCDLTINYIKESATNTTSTSIYLRWSTTSKNCQDVLPNLQKLSYDCSCTPSNKKHRSTTNKLPSGGTCNITGLEPFQVYTCVVQPKYNDKKVPEQKKRVTEETKSGKPDDIDKLLVAVPENNVITVTCDKSRKVMFNGPRKIFNASLLYAGVTQKKWKEDKCDFVFKDLSYSTEYKLEVTAFNGHFHSKTEIKFVTTRYNDKALIGFLVFFIIIAFVALVLAAYKIYRYRKSKNDVRGDVMLEPTEIYVNVPRYKYHHKDTL
ncbi:receptor-type tyrosine-protein phosphatase C-like [Sander lucioperca]|uniref:receptor-type tyrosine-protein phosphatase C-like n=1 Tax=Sander lucioperca TaxID=283035 RepID=UPI001653D909|nr:receptor-type tyrosine-protein phosphatase C-like [Sander lucioperca]